MVAAGTGKIKAAANLKTNVDPNVADVASPEIASAKILDDDRRECGDCALLPEQHYCRRITLCFFDQTFVIVCSLIARPQIVPASRISPFTQEVKHRLVRQREH